MYIYYGWYNPGKFYIAIFKQPAKFISKYSNECEWIVPSTWQED